MFTLLVFPTGLCALPDDLARNIQQMKAASEQMRLEFHHRDDPHNPAVRDTITVERAMNSPVCTVVHTTTEGSIAGQPRSTWDELASVVLRAGDQQLLEDALLLTMNIRCFEHGDTRVELYLGGEKYASMCLGVPAGHGFHESQAEVEVAEDARLAAALQAAPIQRMLRIICRNSAPV